MIKMIYLALVLIVLLPGVFAAVACVESAGSVKRFERDEQSRTTDSVYVELEEVKVGLGSFGVPLNPHVWAAILVLTGFTLCMLGLVGLLFVRLR